MFYTLGENISNKIKIVTGKKIIWKYVSDTGILQKVASEIRDKAVVTYRINSYF